MGSRGARVVPRGRARNGAKESYGARLVFLDASGHGRSHRGASTHERDARLVASGKCAICRDEEAAFGLAASAETIDGRRDASAELKFGPATSTGRTRRAELQFSQSPKFSQSRDRQRAAGHSQAAPRTPLESPCFGGTMRVATRSEKT